MDTNLSKKVKALLYTKMVRKKLQGNIETQLVGTKQQNSLPPIC